MTFKDVSDKLDKLLSFHSVEHVLTEIDLVDTIFVMDLSLTSKFACDAPEEAQQEFNCTSFRAALQSNPTIVSK